MTDTDMTIPPEGTAAPAFALPSTSGDTVSLDSFKGAKNVVLYFYPKDDTPGCTKEACAFRDMSPTFGEHDAVILGVSPDSVASHRAFAAKYTLPFPLLADEDSSVARAYGAWREAAPDGSTRAGIRRSTFVIDKAGVVRRVFPTVKVEEHIPEVLAAVDAL